MVMSALRSRNLGRLERWYCASFYNVDRSSGTQSTSGWSYRFFAAKVDFTTGQSRICIGIVDFTETEADMAVANFQLIPVSVFQNTRHLFNTASSFATKVTLQRNQHVWTCTRDIRWRRQTGPGYKNYSSNTVSIFVQQYLDPCHSYHILWLPLWSNRNSIYYRHNLVQTASNNIVCWSRSGDGYFCHCYTAFFTVPRVQPWHYRNYKWINWLLSSPFNVTFPSSRLLMQQLLQLRLTSQPVSIQPVQAIGDIDGDGKADIVVANSQVITISVFREHQLFRLIAAGSFAARVDFTTEQIHTGCYRI